MSGDRIETPIGRTSVFSGENNKLMYGSEADLRDGLAAMAWLHGWEVVTEVVVPHGGRIDLLISTPDGFRVSFELKKTLGSQRAARLGFQQAEGYRRHWETADPAGTDTVTVLSAPDAQFDDWPEFRKMYPGVHLGPWFFVVGLIRGTYMDEVSDPMGRALVAARRHRQLAHLAHFADTERIVGAKALRSHHLTNLERNYPSMASMLHKALAA